MRVILLIFFALFTFATSFAQLDGDYQSAASGDWDQASSWEVFSGGSWIPAQTTPTNVDGVITIRVGHTISVTSDVTVDQIEFENDFSGNTGILTVESSAILTVANGPGDDIRLLNDFTTFALLQVEGTLNLLAGATMVDDDYENLGIGPGPVTQDTYKVLNGGVHIHNTGAGVDMVPAADWQSGSTCRIHATTSPAPIIDPATTFYDFEWDGSSQGGLISLGSAVRNVTNDFLILDTNGNILQLGTTTNYTLDVGRDFTISGNSRVQFATTATVSINVDRDFTISSTNSLVNTISFTATGTTNVIVARNFLKEGVSLVSLGAGAAGSGSITVAGGFTFSGGAINRNATSTGTSTVIFNGSSLQSYNNTGGTFSNAINFTVEPNAILDFSTSVLGGNGTFTNSGTILVGSPNGTGAVLGNIPVATRIFNTGSTIIYSGDEAQFMGAAQPSGSGINTIINNPDGVSLATNLTLGGNLTLTAGNLDIAGQTLTLNGSITPNSNLLVISPTSSLVINGTGPIGTLPFSGTEINNFTINRTGQTAILGSDLAVGGTLDITAGTLNFSGRSLTINGPYNSGATGNLIGNGSSTLVIGNDPGGTITTEATFIGGNLGTFTLDRPVTINATFAPTTAVNLVQGTLSGSLTMGAGATLNRGQGEFIGTLSAPAGYNLEYSNSANISTGDEVLNQINDFTKSGSGSVTLSKALNIDGNLTISDGTLDAGSNDISLAGNFASQGGNTAFTGSTMTFDGNTTLSGGTAINFANISIASGATLNLGSVVANIFGDIDHDNGGTMLAGTGTVRFSGTTTVSSNKDNIPRFNNLQILEQASLTFDCASGECGTATERNRFSAEVSGNWNSNNAGAVFSPQDIRIIFNGTTQALNMLSTHSFSTLELAGSSSVTLSQPMTTRDDIVIGESATLNTGGGSHNITCGDDFIVNGTFVPNSSTVVFNGASNQSINREVGVAGTIPFHNIEIDKTNGIFNISGGNSIPNTIYLVRNRFQIMQNGHGPIDVDLDGPNDQGILVLESVSDRTARIPPIPDGTTVVGNLTVRRYIQNDAGLRAWRYLASPVVGATVADWQGEIAISGQFSNPTIGGGLIPATPSLYRWNEVINDYEPYPNDSGQPSSAFPLENSRGYAVYVVNEGNPVLDVRGGLRMGDVNINLTNSGTGDFQGYNLVGNPYPAPIDWELVDLPGGVSSTIAIKDNVGNGDLAIGQFVYYAQEGPIVGNYNGNIASSQAFWVSAENAATLTFSEDHKASASNALVIRERQIADLIRIRVQGDGSKDEMVVYFRDGATEGYDLRFDARKLENDFLNLYSYRQGDSGIEKYAINALSGIDCSREILLGLEKFNPGSYSFSFSELESFTDPDLKFTLTDSYAGKSVPLTDTTEYAFQVTADEASTGNERFRVSISRQEFNGALAVAGHEGCDIRDAKITIAASESNVVYQPYYNGLVAGNAVNGNGSDVLLSLDKDAFASIGEYEISIKAFDQCNERFLEQKATVKIVDSLPVQIQNDGNTLLSSYAGDNQQWFLDGVEIPGATGQQITPEESGLYSVMVTTQGGCTGSGELQFVLTGAESDLVDDDIRVYPNPFDGKFQVEVRSAGMAELKIFNTLGLLVGGKQLEGSGPLKSASVDMSSSANGVYIMYIQASDGVRRVRIIKGKD